MYYSIILKFLDNNNALQFSDLTRYLLYLVCYFCFRYKVLNSLISRVIIPFVCRYHKCLSCYEKLTAIREILLKKQSTTPGKLGTSFRDLAVLIRNLEWQKLCLRSPWSQPLVSLSIDNRRSPCGGIYQQRIRDHVVNATPMRDISYHREAAKKSRFITVASHQESVCKSAFLLLPSSAAGWSIAFSSSSSLSPLYQPSSHRKKRIKCETSRIQLLDRTTLSLIGEKGKKKNRKSNQCLKWKMQRRKRLRIDEKRWKWEEKMLNIVLKYRDRVIILSIFKIIKPLSIPGSFLFVRINKSIVKSFSFFFFFIDRFDIFLSPMIF